MNWIKRQYRKIRNLLGGKRSQAVVKKQQSEAVVKKQPTHTVAKELSTRKISADGLAMIKEFEGLELETYICSGQEKTIGYGTTIYPDGTKVKLGDTITKAQAIEFLNYDLLECRQVVQSTASSYGLELTDNQFSALVSFAYNLGPSPITNRSRSLGKALWNGDMQAAADAILLYNKARNKFGILRELKGLTRRRKAERKLFLS